VGFGVWFFFFFLFWEFVFDGMAFCLLSVRMMADSMLTPPCDFEVLSFYRGWRFSVHLRMADAY